MKILRQVVKFGKAYAVWLKEGKPILSDHLVMHIFQTHCAPCEHYDPDLKECSICECSVSENPHERNKIVYATEDCPIGRWDSDHVDEGTDGTTGGGVEGSTGSEGQTEQEH